MLASRVVIATLAVTVTTLVTMVPTMPVMTVMVAMTVMAVVEQRIEGDEGGKWRDIIVAVIRIGRCAGQSQHNQAAGRHNP